MHVIKIEVNEIDNSVFSINTNQNEYLLNESILITAVTNKIIPYESMKFTVIDPTGNQIDSGSLFTIDGNFDTSI